MAGYGVMESPDPPGGLARRPRFCRKRGCCGNGPDEVHTVMPAVWLLAAVGLAIGTPLAPVLARFSVQRE
jgi:hypothetical protein